MDNIVSFEKAKDQKQTRTIEEELNDVAFMESLDARMDNIYQRAKDLNNKSLNTKVKIF